MELLSRVLAVSETVAGKYELAIKLKYMHIKVSLMFNMGNNPNGFISLKHIGSDVGSYHSISWKDIHIKPVYLINQLKDVNIDDEREIYGFIEKCKLFANQLFNLFELGHI